MLLAEFHDDFLGEIFGDNDTFDLFNMKMVSQRFIQFGDSVKFRNIFLLRLSHYLLSHYLLNLRHISTNRLGSMCIITTPKDINQVKVVITSEKVRAILQWNGNIRILYEGAPHFQNRNIIQAINYYRGFLLLTNTGTIQYIPIKDSFFDPYQSTDPRKHKRIIELAENLVDIAEISYAYSYLAFLTRNGKVKILNPGTLEFFDIHIIEFIVKIVWSPSNGTYFLTSEGNVIESQDPFTNNQLVNLNNIVDIICDKRVLFLRHNGDVYYIYKSDIAGLKVNVPTIISVLKNIRQIVVCKNAKYTPTGPTTDITICLSKNMFYINFSDIRDYEYRTINGDFSRLTNDGLAWYDDHKFIMICKLKSYPLANTADKNRIKLQINYPY